MRKRYRILVLAAIVAAFIVPVGFALSLESGATTPHGRYGPPASIAHTVVSAPVLIAVRRPAPTTVQQSVPEVAKLFAVGTVLFGLAAIVRRAV